MTIWSKKEFGQAYLNGRSGIASYYRLSNERYGMNTDDKSVVERFQKEVIHELGHKDAILMACKAKKHILCTKPLALNAEEAREVLDAVEKAGVFHGYLEDLVYTPKTLKAIDMVNNGSCGRILWTRSREAHSGPHSAWFWDKKQSGGGALVDMGCHCISQNRRSGKILNSYGEGKKGSLQMLS